MLLLEGQEFEDLRRDGELTAVGEWGGASAGNETNT